LFFIWLFVFIIVFLYYSRLPFIFSTYIPYLIILLIAVYSFLMWFFNCGTVLFAVIYLFILAYSPEYIYSIIVILYHLFNFPFAWWSLFISIFVF
jgi:hypothetical protein